MYENEMEVTTEETTENYETEDNTEVKSGSGKLITGLVIAGLGLATAAAVGIKKLKDKKADKPKKPKKKLMWVEVPEDDVVDVEAVEVETETK